MRNVQLMEESRLDELSGPGAADMSGAIPESASTKPPSKKVDLVCWSITYYSHWGPTQNSCYSTKNLSIYFLLH